MFLVNAAKQPLAVIPIQEPKEGLMIRKDFRRRRQDYGHSLNAGMLTARDKDREMEKNKDYTSCFHGSTWFW